jgi:hypothetical protein
LKAVQSVIPDATSIINYEAEEGLSSNDQMDYSISILNEEETMTKLPALFSLLEENKTNLGILTMGLSLTTMDQVFLK